MTIDAVVIGAGQAGLATSHHLTARGIEHLVLERGSVGETWRSQRWDSFVLNTPNWMNRLPGETADLEPRDAFLTRDEYVGRLERYAVEHHVPLRTGVAVDAVTGEDDGGSFRITTTGPDGSDVIRARNVVVASGMQRTVKVPPIGSSFPAWIHQSTAAEYRRPDALPTGAVLVVGSGQCGIQIVEDLLAAGRRVYLCTSVVARCPRRYRGRDCFEWLVDAGFFEVALDGSPDPRMRYVTLPTISGVGRYGHTISLQGLAAHGCDPAWPAVGRHRATGSHSPDTVGAAIAFGDRTSAEIKAGVDKGILESTAWSCRPSSTDRPTNRIPIRSRPLTTELDLGTAGIGNVVWATGFTGDFDFLRPPVLDAGWAASTPARRRVVCPARTSSGSRGCRSASPV